MSNNESGKVSEESVESIRIRNDIARLREMLLEGLESPLSDRPWNAKYFQKLRARIYAAEKDRTKQDYLFD